MEIEWQPKVGDSAVKIEKSYIMALEPGTFMNSVKGVPCVADSLYPTHLKAVNKDGVSMEYKYSLVVDAWVSFETGKKCKCFHEIEEECEKYLGKCKIVALEEEK